MNRYFIYILIEVNAQAAGSEGSQVNLAATT